MTNVEDSLREVSNFATIGMIEVLLNPEISTTWVQEEILPPLNASESNIVDAKLVEETIASRLRALAVSLMEDLDEDLCKKHYTHFLQ